MNETDEDLREAKTALRRSLESFRFEGTVHNVIDAVDALIAVRLAMFAEMMADRFEAKMADVLAVAEGRDR